MRAGVVAAVRRRWPGLPRWVAWVGAIGRSWGCGGVDCGVGTTGVAVLAADLRGVVKGIVALFSWWWDGWERGLRVDLTASPGGAKA